MNHFFVNDQANAVTSAGAFMKDNSKTSFSFKNPC